MSDPGPEETSRRLVSFMESGDVEAAMALYEQDAVFAELGGIVQGIDAIRTSFEGFVQSGFKLELRDSVVFETDGIALVHWSWNVTRPDGSTMQGASAEVLRRQADGTWKFLIDNSDGAALIGTS